MCLYLFLASCCSMCRPVCCSMGACFETGEDDDPLQRSLAARCISERFQVIYSLLSHTDRQLDRHTHTVRQARNTQTDIQTGMNTSRLPSTEDIQALQNIFRLELQYQPCLWLGKVCCRAMFYCILDLKIFVNCLCKLVCCISRVNTILT